MGARAGVSYRTVSRVINGDRFVAAATAQAVRQAAADLGFQRNDMARMLRQGDKTFTIGLVVEDLSNPFYARFAQQIAADARRQGYVVLTASGEHDEAIEREVITSFVRRRVDGLIVFPSSETHEYLRPEIDRGTAVVFVDAPARDLATDVVTVANRRGARLAVRHLLTHGHRRIAVLAEAQRLEVAHERVAGYRDALRTAGIPVDKTWIVTELRSTDDASRATTTLLSDSKTAPTALFSANNRITVGALTATRGMRRPVAIVGFGDFETAPLLSPGVTVVRHEPADMATKALDLLLARMKGAYSGPPKHIKLPVELIARGSGEVEPPTDRRARGRA